MTEVRATAPDVLLAASMIAMRLLLRPFATRQRESVVTEEAPVTRLGGYDADIDPLTLSVGERQLIALTRAYLSTAPVVILDEAACHLDPAAGQIAENAFALRGGTLIVIAHRITTALRARRILVLDGTHAHTGDHIKVLGDSPMYRDLVGHWTHTG